jgi:hypothetical protein
LLIRLLREPLLHFLLLGGLLFAIFGHGGAGGGAAGTQIVVTAADIARLSEQFARTWHRPPAADELQAQIDDYIREEVLYRTALTLGLDRDDTIIRRRLRQKMDFLSEGAIAEPQEADLLAYFHAHEDKFRAEPAISFRQILISGNRGAAAEGDARQLLTKLVAAGPGAVEGGDPSLLAEGFDAAPLSRIADLFGEAFARALAGVRPGEWAGPLPSAYGYHLVRVAAVEPARLPPFEQVRAAVEREWLAEHRAAALDAQYRKLLAQYQVRIDDAPPAAARP